MTQLEGRQAPGTPVWIDHMAKNATAARAFYGELLGWEFMDSGPEFGNYAMATSGGRMAAGQGIAPAAYPVDAVWSVYVEVDDPLATTARATELGGQIVLPADLIPTVGEMAVVADPTGALIGLWRSDPFTGVGATGEPGFAGWHELLTTDLGKACDFYGGLFGWTFAPMEGTDEYVTAHLPGVDEPVAGIGVLPEDAPAVPYWQSYLQVEDVDAACEVVKSHGGSVTGEPVDTPNGRMATAADPDGAAFALFSAPDD